MNLIPRMSEVLLLREYFQNGNISIFKNRLWIGGGGIPKKSVQFFFLLIRVVVRE